MIKIIVIGMDNTGKTTLSKELSKKMKIKYFKSCGPLNKQQQLLFMDNFLKQNQSIICDRFPLFDELVYGKILRGKSNFGLNDNLFKRLIENNTIIIYCRPKNNVIKKWNDREQMNGVIEKADELIEAYDSLVKRMRKLNINIIKYDYTKGFENVIYKIQ